jgi:hypothetical protein
MVIRWALAPVAACDEATKPGLAPNGSLNQRARKRGTETPQNPSLTRRVVSDTADKSHVLAVAWDHCPEPVGFLSNC